MKCLLPTGKHLPCCWAPCFLFGPTLSRLHVHCGSLGPPPTTSCAFLPGPSVPSTSTLIRDDLSDISQLEPLVRLLKTKSQWSQWLFTALWKNIDKTETVDTCLRSKQSSLDYVAIFRTEFQLLRVCPLSFRKNHTYVTCYITNRNDLL